MCSTKIQILGARICNEEDTRLNYLVNPTRLSESIYSLTRSKQLTDDRWNSIKIKRQAPSGLP